MADTKIEFRKILSKNAKIKHNVYAVVKNSKSQVLNNFKNLQPDTRDKVKDLITKMAIYGNEYNSTDIRWKMRKKYDYGELKPHGHRFFFFIKVEDNIIFFRYAEKKKDSLGDKTYKKIQKEKDKYEKEFERYISGC